MSCCTVAEYEGNDTLTRYCEKGQRFVEGWNCSRRRDSLMNRKEWDMDHPNVQALYRCCLAVSQAAGRSGNGPQLPPPEVKYDDVQIRSDFPESWLFKDNLVSFGYV